MELALILISSFAIGVAVTAPIGPINIMVIRTSLKHGFMAGIWVGLGSVIGDGIFAAIAAFGLKALFSFFEGFTNWLQLFGGIFMVGYGIFVILSGNKPHPSHVTKTPKKVIGNITPIGATLALTLTNPATMLGFIGLFSALSGLVDYTSSQFYAVLIVAGVMMGSLSWICSLSAFISWLHKNLSERAIKNIDKITSIALIIFGGVVLGRLALSAL